MEKEENSHEQASSLQFLITLLRDNTVEEPEFESRSCRPSCIIVVGQDIGKGTEARNSKICGTGGRISLSALNCSEGVEDCLGILQRNVD